MKAFHFYGSNVAEWKTSSDLQEVIKWFKKQPELFSVWLVPCEESDPYEIKWYAPQVEGSICLGTWRKELPFQSN